MATDRIRLTLSGESGVSVRLAFPRADLTAALFGLATDAELSEGGAQQAGEMALKILLGAGGVNLSGVAEEFTLNAWGDQVAASDVSRWNRCAALIDAAFGLAGSGVVDGADGVEESDQPDGFQERIREILAAEAADREMREHGEDDAYPLTADDYAAAFGVTLLEREVQAAVSGPDDAGQDSAQRAEESHASDAPFSVVLHGEVHRPFGWSDQGEDWRTRLEPLDTDEQGPEFLRECE